jgi:hypothetical protein
VHSFNRPAGPIAAMPRFALLPAALLCLAFPAAAQADRSWVVTPGPVVVPAGAPVVISGRIVGDRHENQEVILSRDAHPYGDGFKRERTTRTNRDGDFRFTRPADENANFRVRSGDLQADVVVRVRYVIALAPSTLTPRRGQMVRFTGTVLPASTGFARLQRRTATGAYATVRSARLVAPAGDCPQPQPDADQPDSDEPDADGPDRDEPGSGDPIQPTTDPTTTTPTTGTFPPSTPDPSDSTGPGGEEPTGQPPDGEDPCSERERREAARQPATYSILFPVFFTGNYRVVTYYDGKRLTSFSPVRRLTVVPGEPPEAPPADAPAGAAPPE